ncbi:hypothetical protein GCM10023116_03810 [Kistimonas scapharcae]|uniref:Uncharacterized protein n=1 Tax=Kistimonas scapharcae TaxID=1036133 RepID=A0ABP8UWY0_9GAMM
MAKKAEEKTENTDLAIFGGQADALPPATYEQDAGLGNTNVSSEDMAIPRIMLLQALSKVVQDGLEGARPGLFHNTITDEMHESLYIIPVDYQKEYSVFKKRDLGGGFQGAFESMKEASDHVETLQGGSAGYDITESGKQVFLVLEVKDGKAVPSCPVIMHFTNTQLGVSNSFNSQIQMSLPDGAPRFAGVWEMSTEKRSNSKGSWHVPKFDFKGLAGAELYDAAKKLYLSINQKAEAA